MGQAPDSLSDPGDAEGQRPKEIRDEIEQTRAEMSRTVDAIQERLSPAHITEQVKESVREASIGRAEEMITMASDTARGAGSTFMEAIRRNPIAAAMAGIGLAWLYYNRAAPSRVGYNRWERNYDSRPVRYGSRRSDAGYREGTPDTGAAWERGQPRGTAGGPDWRPGMRTPARDWSDRNAEEGQSWTEQTGDTAQQAADTARQWGQAAADTAGEWSDQAYQQAMRARGALGDVVEDYPLAAGALALIAGAAVGLAVPSTDVEGQWMGEAREQFVQQATTRAQNAMEKAQQVASRAAESATSAIKEETGSQSKR